MGRRFASRAAVAAAVAALATLAATAVPVSATAGAASAVTVPEPTLRLIDAADTPGKLDLRSARLSQSAGSLVFTFRVNRRFAVSELSGRHDRVVCVDIVPRGHPGRGERVCLIGRRGGHALYRLPLAPGGPRPRFVAAHVQHVLRGAKVTFAYARIGLRPERLDWSATTTWKGRAACSHLCHDSVPDRGRAGWRETGDGELRELLRPTVEAEGWVIDSDYRRKLGTYVMEHADTVVWLDLPLHVSLRRLLRRTVPRIRLQQELWNGNTESWRDAFGGWDSLFVYAIRKHASQRRSLPELLARPELAHLQVVRLRTPAAVATWLGTLGDGKASKVA